MPGMVAFQGWVQWQVPLESIRAWAPRAGSQPVAIQSWRISWRCPRGGRASCWVPGAVGRREARHACVVMARGRIPEPLDAHLHGAYQMSRTPSAVRSCCCTARPTELPRPANPKRSPNPSATGRSSPSSQAKDTCCDHPASWSEYSISNSVSSARQRRHHQAADRYSKFQSTGQPTWAGSRTRLECHRRIRSY